MAILLDFRWKKNLPEFSVGGLINYILMIVNLLATCEYVFLSLKKIIFEDFFLAPVIFFTFFQLKTDVCQKWDTVFLQIASRRQVKHFWIPETLWNKMSTHLKANRAFRGMVFMIHLRICENFTEFSKFLKICNLIDYSLMTIKMIWITDLIRWNWSWGHVELTWKEMVVSAHANLERSKFLS